jgi:exonuclease VII small subunit
MQDKVMTLKSLEDDVAELQALVKELDSQEKELRKAVINLDRAKSTKQAILAPETNR